MAKSCSSRPLRTSSQCDPGVHRSPNVTLEFADAHFPCPVCGRLHSLGITKNKKPYLTCNDCLVQVFIRGKEGIKKLRNAELFESLVGSRDRSRTHAQVD